MNTKFKIWTEECKNDTDENLVYLKLVLHKHERTQENSYVGLMATDKNGDKILQGGIIALDFDENIIVILDNISEKIPLKTDFHGCALTVSESEFNEKQSDTMKEIMLRQMVQEIKAKKEESDKADATIN